MLNCIYRPKINSFQLVDLNQKEWRAGFLECGKVCSGYFRRPEMPGLNRRQPLSLALHIMMFDFKALFAVGFETFAGVGQLFQTGADDFQHARGRGRGVAPKVG